MPKSLIGLGANLEHPDKVLIDVVQRLENMPAVKIVDLSPVYQTLPIGGPHGQNVYLNATVVINSNYEASDLLALLQGLENALGRTHDIRWGSRIIDLDLLLHGDEIINTPKLILPHPRMTFRRFVLHPSCDIAADMIHPTTRCTLNQLLNHLNQTLNYIVLSGGTEEDRTTIVRDAKKELASHGIELIRESSRNEVGRLPSKTWIVSDQSEGFGSVDSKDKIKLTPPKLLVLLNPIQENESNDGSLRTVTFSGPQLQLGNPGCTLRDSVVEVVAAIMAMTLMPIPEKHLSLKFR